MGDMHATFKSSGKMPVSIDLLKITVGDSAIISAISFKSFGDIRSCPVALGAVYMEASQPGYPSWLASPR
jgi:hypothetical protein